MSRSLYFSFFAILTSCVGHSQTDTATPPLITPPQPPVTDAEPALKPKLIAGQYTVQRTEHGKMSWYSVKTNGGTKTASGKPFSNNGATAAHKKINFGTKVRVTNLRNGRSEIVTITDRGPFIKGRIIDVSIGTARKLDFINDGVVPCKVEILTKPSEKPSFLPN